MTRAEALDRGARMEQEEHEWLTPEEARRVARDHLKEDPHYYGKVRGAPRMVGRRRV